MPEEQQAQQARELTPEQQNVAAQVQSAQAQSSNEPAPAQVYFSGSSYGGQPASQEHLQQQVPQEQQQQNEQPNLQPDLQQLADKVGIKPEELGQAPPPEPEQPPLAPDDWYKQQFGSAEAQQFAENFKKYLGMDIKEVYGVINQTAQVTKGLESWRQQVAAQQQQQAVQAQLQTLQQEMGDEYSTIMPLVKQEFDRIRQVNPAQAQALDNVDGARYLAAYIRQRQQQQQAAPTQRSVPQYDFPNVRRPVTGNTPPSPTITMSDFLTWDDATVQNRMQDIMLAKQYGTFVHDI